MSYLEARWMEYWLDVLEGGYEAKQRDSEELPPIKLDKFVVEVGFDEPKAAA